MLLRLRYIAEVSHVQQVQNLNVVNGYVLMNIYIHRDQTLDPKHDFRLTFRYVVMHHVDSPVLALEM
jgi:hypothetical protein